MKVFGIPFFENKAKPQKASVNRQIAVEQQLQRIRQDASTFKIAVTSAESVNYPNRTSLIQCYNNVVVDAQVSAAIYQRKMRILSSKFLLKDAAGNKSEKVEFLDKQWFYDFMDLAIDSIFWGYSLIEIGDIVNDNISGVKIVPRQYVCPEMHIVKANTASITGVNYTELPYSDWSIGVGKERDLGLLMKVAPYAIWKNNAFGAWSEFAEVFGTPFRMGKTNTRDAETRANMENMMRNWSVASWAVFDNDDDVEILANGQSDSYNVYDKLVERCNNEIAKIILGQTSTIDEKSYAGSAKVHENVLNMITKMDMVFMKNVINDKLLPLMTRIGIDMSGLSFTFDESEEIGVIEQAKIDSLFLGHVKFDKDYLEQKYGFKIDDSYSDEQISNAITNLYKK